MARVTRFSIRCRRAGTGEVDADPSALAAATETHHKRHLGVSLCPIGSLSGSREEISSQHEGLIKLATENASQSAEGDVQRHK